MKPSLPPRSRVSWPHVSPVSPPEKANQHAAPTQAQASRSQSRPHTWKCSTVNEFTSIHRRRRSCSRKIRSESVSPPLLSSFHWSPLPLVSCSFSSSPAPDAPHPLLGAVRTGWHRSSLGFPAECQSRSPDLSSPRGADRRPHQREISSGEASCLQPNCRPRSFLMPIDVLGLILIHPLSVPVSNQKIQFRYGQSIYFFCYESINEFRRNPRKYIRGPGFYF